ncbi:cryptochrome/photolyase family protein [Candidatus Foliamicus sp.]
MQTGQAPVLLWLRRDLRVADNPALLWAARSGAPVVPVFVLEGNAAPRPEGAAVHWWLHYSLDALAASLKEKGSRLILRRGSASENLRDLLRETGAQSLVWNRLYDPAERARDEKMGRRLTDSGITVRSFNSGLLFEPWTVQTGRGTPYRVFTQFWRTCLQRELAKPVSEPKTLAAPETWPRSEALDAWSLLPGKPDWAGGLRATWQPGEQGAMQRLEEFLAQRLEQYPTARDFPGKPGSSMLSPHLHWGEIGPRQVCAALEALPPNTGSEAFRRELGWREFSHHLLFHNPDMGAKNLRGEFDRMPWRDDASGLLRWQRGQTGYPLVDAGMRQLWHTGWMHNRVRMVAASFLVKHLLIDWRRGAEWFWDTLVDADWANNSAGWQWVAGSGADAAPYFRIFNPVVQSQRFDAQGDYLRAWLPELQALPARWIHAPWTAPPTELQRAGVALGQDYPLPIVDHAEARQRALFLYRKHVRR